MCDKMKEGFDGSLRKELCTLNNEKFVFLNCSL